MAFGKLPTTSCQPSTVLQSTAGGLSRRSSGRPSLRRREGWGVKRLRHACEDELCCEVVADAPSWLVWRTLDFMTSCAPPSLPQFSTHPRKTPLLRANWLQRQQHKVCSSAKDRGWARLPEQDPATPTQRNLTRALPGDLSEIESWRLSAARPGRVCAWGTDEARPPLVRQRSS